jgi:hypothetical protein
MSGEWFSGLTAERRKSLATAEGRGFEFRRRLSRDSGERFFRRYRGSWLSVTQTTAFGRG